MTPIITTKELALILNNTDLLIFDARVGKDAYRDYQSKHIKGARNISLETDFAKVPSNAANGGRHPLPLLEEFKQTLENFGLTENSHVVIYDTQFGANAAARLWWMLRAFGLEKIQVLSGGYQAAERDGIIMSSGDESFAEAQLEERMNWSLPTVSIEEVENILKTKTGTIIDVRDAYRYDGESEPIDLVAGHIPGAINIPYSENLDQEGCFLNADELREKYQQLLVDKNEQLSIHCGSGVTACHTILALVYAGFEVPNLYVGSWSEWSRRDKPVAKNV